MGCGCNKKVQNRTFRSASATKKSAQGGISSGATPAQLRSLNAKQALSPNQERKMDAQRRRIDQLRRNAIKRKGSK